MVRKIPMVLLVLVVAALGACQTPPPAPPQGERVQVYDSGCAMDTLVLGQETCVKQVVQDYLPSDVWACDIIRDGDGYRLKFQKCAEAAYCKHGAVYPPKVGEGTGNPEFLKHNRVTAVAARATITFEVDCKNLPTNKFVIDPSVD